jgi:hypothetical protein
LRAGPSLHHCGLALGGQPSRGDEALTWLLQLFGFDREATPGERLQAKLFELFLLQYAVRWAWEWAAFIAQQRAIVVPHGLARYVDLSPLLAGPFAWINALCVTAAALGVAAGRCRRALLPALVVLLHVQYAARHGLGKVSHGSQYVGVGLLVLAVAAWAFPAPAARQRFERGASLFFMGVGYVLAACSKLIASGLGWVHGRHLWLWIGEKGVDQLANLGHWEQNQLQRLCLQHVWLATALLGSGLAAELSGWLLWFARTRVTGTLLLIGLHLGIYGALGILFDAFIYQLLVLGLPWSRWFDQWLPGAPAPADETSQPPRALA